MSGRRALIWRLVILVALGLVGAGCGVVAISPAGPQFLHGVETYPMPHHVARYPGGVSLRLAMVHDTIHERFPKHGRAHFEERNRVTEAALRREENDRAAGAAPSDRYFELLDDLAVGLERLGRHDEAIALMRDKLKRQEALGRTGRDLYSGYANLGTFLVLRLLDRGAADAEAARAELRESADLVRKSVELNPEAHFGREEWQVALLDFLLAALDDPDLLLRFDMVGDRLGAPVEPERRYAYDPGPHLMMTRKGLRAFLEDPDAGDRADPKRRDNLRTLIREVGPGTDDGQETPPHVRRKAVPFDEPVLGIIGMWQYGGGANPHFALAWPRSCCASASATSPGAPTSGPFSSPRG